MSGLEARLEADVLSAAGGDREAFGRLVDATKRSVASIALAIVGDIHASQDVAQEVFLSAWRSLGKLRNPASFLPWLRQMTRNRARTWLRDEGRRRHLGMSTADDLLAAAADPRAAPGEQMERLEEIRLVGEALAELPVDTREVVTLFYREGRSVAQVAELLELSPDAVKQRLSRARRRLREDLAARFETALRRTAPGAAFTGALLASLTAAAPPASAAVAVVAASKTGSAASVAKLALLLGGAGLGAVGGVAGIVMGLRRHFRDARSDHELRSLRVFQAMGIGVVLLACGGLLAAGALASPATAIVVYVAFLVALWAMYFVWLPAIVGPRLAAERAEDPAAASRQERDRRLSRVGYLAGLLMGGAGLLMGLWKAGYFS